MTQSQPGPPTITLSAGKSPPAALLPRLRTVADALRQVTAPTGACLLVIPEPKAKPIIEPLCESRQVFGRRQSYGWAQERGKLSRDHFEILRPSPGEWSIRDLGSRNGTTLNDKPIGDAPVPLHDGDLIEAGRIILVVLLPEP